PANTQRLTLSAATVTPRPSAAGSDGPARLPPVDRTVPRATRPGYPAETAPWCDRAGMCYRSRPCVHTDPRFPQPGQPAARCRSAPGYGDRRIPDRPRADPWYRVPGPG